MPPHPSPTPPPALTQDPLARSLQAAREALAQLRGTLALTAKAVGQSR